MTPPTPPSGAPGPFGRLERVNVKEHWHGEATDFTPWLARPENLALLGQALELEPLEDATVEQPVGDFRADIVARTGEMTVLIENQFGRTDHDHLGKLLVYGSGKDADVVIWIAERFREEHRSAIDWMNEKTGDGLDFFAVSIELWQIGASLPAPRFNVICKPNDWRRVTEGGDPDAAQNLRFWQTVIDRAEDAGTPLPIRGRLARNWVRIGLGKAGFYFVLARLASGEVYCELRIRAPAKAALFEALRDRREMLEHATGPLEWIEQEGVAVRRIVCRRPPPEEGEDDESPSIDWLINRTVAFRAVVTKLMPDLPWHVIPARAVDADEPL